MCFFLLKYCLPLNFSTSILSGFLSFSSHLPASSSEKSPKTQDKTNNSNDGLDSPSEAVEERNWLGSNLSESFVTQMVEKAVDKVFVEDPKRAETLNRDHIIKTALDKLKEETLNSKMNPNQKVQSSSIGFPSYKPTPIAELNKRHIPVMYAPERPLSVIRKEKGSDDKSQMSISTLSSTFAADPFKPWGESRGSKYSLNSSAFPAPIQESVTEDNSLDTKEDSSLGEMMDCQNEDNYASIDEKIDISDVLSLSKACSQSVTNQLICDDVFTQFGVSRALTEQNELVKELQLGSGNSLLAKNATDEGTFEQIGLVEGSTSDTLVVDLKEEKSSSTISLVSSSKMDLSGISNEQITVPEKKDSHKHGLKSHSSRKLEGSKSSDKHRTKKSSDSALNDKGEQRSSKDKRRSKDREKNEEQNRQTKCKGSKSETEKNISSQPLAPSESVARDDHSKVKRVDKMSDKNDKYSKSSEKVDRNDKHNDHKQRDGKRSQGSKSSSDEVRKKSSSSKHSSNKHTSHHHKDKLNVESSNHTKSVSSSHRKDDVSKPKKRKLDEQLQHPEKRMKVSSKTTAEANYTATDIDIFADSKKESGSLTKSSAYNNHCSLDVFDDSESDDMYSDSVLYSPKIQDLDAISISSADSALAADNCEDGWTTVASKKLMRRRASQELQTKPSSQVDSIGTVSDTKWTKAKEMILKANNSKIRIAHVPNVLNILSAKTRLLSKAPPDSMTHISTKPSVETDSNPLPRVTKRIAHGAQTSTRFPSLIHSQEIKINASVRQHYCNVFYKELGKFLDAEEAITKAAEEEYAIAMKCSLSKIYKNNCSLLLLKIRKSRGNLKIYEAPTEKLEPESTPEYTYGWNLYKCFSKYLMSEEELVQHGYPMPLPGQSTCAYIEKGARRYYVQQPDKPFTKQCANCSKLYEIDEDGMPTTSNDCWYHWGRLRKIPGRVQSSEKFTCCDGANDAPPCQTSPYHVWYGRNEDCMPGFVRTREFPSNREESSAGIFALDCEMCYTTQGLELARLTVVNLNEDVVFDEVISLESPVLDYCTRFSGIDENKMQQATHSFSDVQQWVINNIYDKSIIVGHSLENDLKVLKVFHKRIVDTSVTFPHKFGFPQKCSLKFLARSILSMTIQESENGHDSKEDAVTCLKLIMKKIREDSKIRKPRVIISFSGKKR